MRDREPRIKTPEDREEKVVQIRRVTKVVKGGKKMSFRAIVVVGDRQGHVGVGIGKANEVSAAIRKGVEAGKREEIFVPLVGSTIPHEALGRFGASRVVLRPARAGTGVIAGGSARTILELSGIRDVVAKSLGSANAINVARATVEGLRTLRTQDQEELRRGKPLKIRMIQSPVKKAEVVPSAS